jgi:chemotaxis protein methyltransferase CheR
MSSAESDHQRALRALLLPRLGHAPEAWPAAVARAVDRIAAQRRIDGPTLVRQLLDHPHDPAVDEMVAAATIPHTRFFRHSDQFERLRNELPRIGARAKPVKIWSAGCATGEEVWSLALLAQNLKVDVDILGTDVSPAVLAVAREGRYARISVDDALVPMPTTWAAPDDLRASVRFRRASIAEPRPSGGDELFDLVLCRNVLIYFPASRLSEIASALARSVRPRGALILAPVEALIARPEMMRHTDPLGWFEIDRSAPLPKRESTVPPPAPAVSNEDEGGIERAARALGLGQENEAERLLRQVLGSDPKCAEAWFLLGESLLRRAEHTQAKVAFERAAQCATGSPHADALAHAAERRARSAAPEVQRQ